MCDLENFGGDRLLFEDREFDTTIQSTPTTRTVGRDGSLKSVPFKLQPRFVDTLSDKKLHHRARSSS